MNTELWLLLFGRCVLLLICNTIYYHHPDIQTAVLPLHSSPRAFVLSRFSATCIPTDFVFFLPLHFRVRGFQRSRGAWKTTVSFTSAHSRPPRLNTITRMMRRLLVADFKVWCGWRYRAQNRRHGHHEVFTNSLNAFFLRSRIDGSMLTMIWTKPATPDLMYMRKLSTEEHVRLSQAKALLAHVADAQRDGVFLMVFPIQREYFIKSSFENTLQHKTYQPHDNERRIARPGKCRSS